MAKIDSFVLPAWTKSLPDNANLNAKDLAGILGVSVRMIHYYISSGKFIEPDYLSKRASGHYTYSKYWSLKALRAFENETKKKAE